MELHWLLTSTFYGNWLPGDSRGFVSRVRDRRAEEPLSETRMEHDVPGTDYDSDYAGLHHSARARLVGEPVWLTEAQAIVLLAQFRTTAAHRGWNLRAAVMANHVHLLVGVPKALSPTKVLGDFKAYGSRALTTRWGKPASNTWWTYGGSKRKKEDENALQGAILYVRDQQNILAIYLEPGVDPPSEVASNLNRRAGSR